MWYFQMVRFVGMVGVAYLAYRSYEAGEDLYPWIYGLSAVLINPIFKISLGRSIWNMVDVIWAVLLLYTVWKESSEKSS